MPCREQDHSMARWGQVATRHRAVTVALMLRCRPPLCLRHVGEWQLRGALSCRTVNFRAQGTSKENLGTDLEWCFGCFHGLGVPDGFARDPCGQNGFDCQSLQWVPFSTFMPPEAILGTSWQIDSKGPQTACNHLPWPRSSQSWLCCRWWMFCALISTPFRPLGTHHIRSFQMLVPVGGAQEAADTGHSSFQISQEILANLSFAAVTQLPISGSRGHLR